MKFARRIGCLNQKKVFDSHPDAANTATAVIKLREKYKDDYEEQSKDMSLDEKINFSSELGAQMSLAEDSITKAIKEDVNRAIDIVSREEGCLLVLDLAAVVRGGMDITDSVIKRLRGIVEARESAVRKIPKAEPGTNINSLN